MTEATCTATQLELSVAHDTGASLTGSGSDHVATCKSCADFQAGLRHLDELLGAGSFDSAPDVHPAIAARRQRSTRWSWIASVAAIFLLGLAVGAAVNGLGRTVTEVRAGDVPALAAAGHARLESLRAEVTIVESGWHPQVPERTFRGSIEYLAPETLSLVLGDVTDYPSDEWVPNDTISYVADGTVFQSGPSGCAVAALPNCLVAPRTTATIGVGPFSGAGATPIGIVAGGSTLRRSGGLEVIGHTSLGGRSVIQIEASMASAGEFVSGLVGVGAWREWHPSDRVRLWLDRDHYFPVRIEVFAADTPDRNLWSVRRGYADESTTALFIVQFDDIQVNQAITIAPPDWVADTIVEAGFVDGVVDLDLEPPAGFVPHRSGTWSLPDGARVETLSWSDASSWITVEVTSGWAEPRLFGVADQFVAPMMLESGVVYLAATGDRVALHSEGRDAVVAGTADVETLLGIAAQLGYGDEIPRSWNQAANVDGAPPGWLTLRIDGWAEPVVRAEDGRVRTLVAGSGSESVTLVEADGATLLPPAGADVYSVTVRGEPGRYSASSGSLEWIEGGRRVTLQSAALDLESLLELAATLEPGS